MLSSLIRTRGLPRQVLLLGFWAAICLFLIAQDSQAQSGPYWVGLDESPRGAPADIIFDESQSSTTDSFFDVFVHGFWVHIKTDTFGQYYQRIEIPGMGTLDEVGAPDLPALRVDLAVTTGAQSATLTEVNWINIWTLWDYLVWPQPLDELDHEEGTPERFVRDDRIYSGHEFWPPEYGTSPASTRNTLGSIPTVSPVVYPVKWNPASRRLQVGTHIRYGYSHGIIDKSPTSFPLFTRERIRQAKIKFFNWPAVDDLILPNPVFYDGEYLFITPADYLDELEPLIKQKKARGFHVSIVTAGITRSTCSSIRTAINSWYAATPDWRDHYCLLVGDTDVIPLCTAPIINDDFPSGFPTEDLYGSTNGDDLDEEVYVGRLSVDDETDVAEQVERILKYEDSPQLYCCYDQVALVAHKEEAPGKYVGAHESVRTAFYAVPPNFLTFYGNTLVRDSDVSSALEDGLGLIAYRGHGSSAAWTKWNVYGDYYDGGDVLGLANGPHTPVVWSFACQNQRLDISESIGEAWMNLGEHGAVSHYASTVNSYTSQNHELDRRMFRAVYHLGLTTQSHAIEYAEAKIIEMGWKSNPWMYLLLGDPDMQIRRRNPMSWIVLAPDMVDVCPSPPCFLDFTVLDQNGRPLSDVLVAVWKPGPVTKGTDAADEVLDNRYTAADGTAQIPAEPTRPGWLYYTVQDDSGNSLLDSILVVAKLTDAGEAVAENVVPELRGRRAAILGADPNPFNPTVSIRFALASPGPVTLDVYNLQGQRVRRLVEGEIPAGNANVRWYGIDANGNQVAAGIYFVRLSAGGVEDILKLALVK